jgi:hypothetical protein
VNDGPAFIAHDFPQAVRNNTIKATAEDAGAGQRLLADY